MTNPVGDPSVFTADKGEMPFTQVEAQLFGTATAASGAATLNAYSGKITTESLSTAAGATYTLTLTDNGIAAEDGLLVTVGNGTNSAGTPAVANATAKAGSATIVVQNIHASSALNGTLVVTFKVLKS